VIFLARRLTALLGLLFVLSVGVFALLYASPGNAADVLLGSRPRTPEMIAAVNKEYHLDDPLYVQYGRWFTGALHFDFGTSIRTGEPVVALFQRQAPPTLFLVGYALILTMIAGVGLGFLAAYYRGTVVDRLVVVACVVGASSPAFATAILLIFLFGLVIPVFPVFGSGTGFLGQVYYLTLPAIALSSTTMALVAKLTRAALIGAFEQDYVSFARARGIGTARVILMYGFRNAVGPILTSMNLVLANLIFGIILVEVTFALPGLGSLLMSSVTYHDVPVIQAFTLLTGAIIILVNLLVDLLYLVGDPRVGFGRSAR
jgi:peptide/nickel transport system permease protein